MIKIKDFAERTGFSIRMLRYLEEVGLLIPQREANNYRVYFDDQIEEARKIKDLQNLGIQLREIEEMRDKTAEAQLKILENVLVREMEVAEIKSETIPALRSLIEFVRIKNKPIEEYTEGEREKSRKLRSLGTEGNEKFRRTAYSMPILREIYEDHIAKEADVELIATDLLKFGQWIDECKYLPQVFSALKDTSFVFGNNINEDFIRGYENSWKKFLPAMGLEKLEDFTKEDITQLMGPHDIIIRTWFKYNADGKEGEIVIPYAPVFTMAQLSKG